MLIRISAIVPVYNTENYIRSALDSLLAQTVKFYEIIVINDGSTDSSHEILKEYETAGKIKLLTQSNQGQGSARNAGVELAQGEYIYFFDSDDLASTALVQTIQREFESHRDLDLVAFAGDSFFDNSSTQLDFLPNYERPVVGKCGRFFDAVIAMDACQSNYCSPCLFVIRKSVIEKNNIRFHVNFHEDEAFMLDLTATVGPCMVLSDKLFRRRVRAGSTMTTKKNASHIKGYLHASVVAKKYAVKSDSSRRKEYFYKKSLQHYLQAVLISYRVENFNCFDSVYKRVAGLPTWRFSFRQLVRLLLGKKTPMLKSWLIKISQSRRG